LKLEQISKISGKAFWKKISSFFKARNSSPEIYLWYMGTSKAWRRLCSENFKNIPKA